MAEDTRSGATPAPVLGADIRTFLFADMRGYTGYTQEHGDDAASALAGRFADLVREAVPGFEGELLELRGDEALCVFRSARQAVRASVELQRRLRTSTDGWDAFPLGVGMALDAGEAVPTQGGYRGKALNLAARLCALARPGQVLATEGVVHLAHRVDGVRFVGRRQTRVKGVEEPVGFVEVQPVEELPPLPSPPGQRGGKNRLVITGVIATLLVLVAVGTLVVSGLIDSSAKRPASTGLPVAGLFRIGLDNRLAPVVSLKRAEGIEALAFGGGSLWISADPGLERYDMDTGQVHAVTINGGGAPIAFGDGRLFVYGGGPGNDRNYANVYVPGNPVSVDVIELQPFSHLQAPGPLAYSLGSLWAWEYGAVGCCPGKTLWRVDPTSPHHVLGRWIGPSAGAGPQHWWLPHGVAVGSEGTWVIRGGILTRVNPTPQAPAPIDQLRTTAVVEGGGVVWAVSQHGSLIEINPTTGLVSWSHNFGEIDDIAVGDGSVWLENQTQHTIQRVDIVTRHRYLPVKLPTAPGPIAVGPTGLWVAFPAGQYAL